jgi:hypothetical protein
VTEIKVGAGGLSIVKVTVPVLPAGVVTLIFLAESVAVGETVKVAVMVVGFATFTLPMVTPPAAPTTFTVVPEAVKLVPVSVTKTLLPRVPVFGVIDDRVAGGGLLTAKVTFPEVPPGVVTLTL